MKSKASVPLFRERRWIVVLKVLVDLASLQLALGLGYYVRIALADIWPITSTFNQYLDLSLAMTLLPIGFWLMKLYPGYGLSLVERLRRKTRVTFTFFLILAVWEYFAADIPWSRGIFLIVLLFALIIPAFFQSFLRYFLIEHNLWGTPVVLLGAGLTGSSVVASLGRDSSLGFVPIAVFDDDSSLWGNEIEGVPVVGGIEQSTGFADVVKYAILAMPGAGRERIVKLSEFLPFPNILIVPDLLGLQSLWVEVRDLGGIPGMEIQRQLLIKRNLFFKRSVDYILGIPLAIMSLPIILLCTLCIRLVSSGSPFFIQEREGEYGKLIRILKLRTMYQNAEEYLEQYLEENHHARDEWQQFFKLKKDPRILPVIGNFLRKTSLDELPQLWNVLKGDMALVGPRPFPCYHLDHFSEEFRHLRSKIKPGLTGLWQVSARSDGDLLVQERLDTYYIRNWSLWLDIVVIAKTIRIVLTGKGAY